MNLEVHILTHDAEQMIEWAIRYWRSLNAWVVVHDGGPKGLSTSFVKQEYANEIRLGVVKCVPWDTAGQLNDELAMKLKNDCWHGTDADWVAVMDCDELLYFPDGEIDTLETYDRRGAAVIRPYGFEMFSDKWIEPSDHQSSQITDLVKDGALDDEWYSKPVLFSPKRVIDSGFGVGAHESDPTMRNGMRFHVGKDWPHPNPPCYLLHFKSIFGGVQRIAQRYDETRKRLAAVNVKNQWGNFAPGIDHALEKRARLLPLVHRIIH